MKIPVPHYFTSCLPRSVVAVAALGLWVGGSSLKAQTNYWDTNNGEWTNAGNWTEGLPTGTSRIYFSKTATSDQSVIDVTIADGANALTDSLGVGYGKTVNLSLGEGASLDSKGWVIGGNSPTGVTSAAGNIKVSSTGTATVTLTNFQVGGLASGPSGNKAEFSGPNLTVDITLGASIGRYRDSNETTISNGATVTANSQVWLGNVTDIANGTGNDNKLFVTGSGSRLVLTNPGSSSLAVASRAITGAGTNVRQTGNAVQISDGGSIFVDGTGVSTAAAVKIGSNQYKQSNFISVTGENSLLELKGNTGIDIGYNGTATWDNYLLVKDGGVVKNEGYLSILGNRSTGALNRLVIDNGTYSSGSTISITGGGLQITNGGKLLGETWAGAAAPLSVTIQNSANTISRFEVGAGSVIGSTVSTTIKDGSVFAIVNGGSMVTTNVLDLNSSISMEANSVFETTIFGGGLNDVYQLDINAPGLLMLANGSKLKLSLAGYDIVGGERWQLFTGDAAGVTGIFDLGISSLPTLAAGLEWDTTDFNESGNWTLAVSAVPEPSSLALLGIATVAGGWIARRRWSRNG